MVEMSLSDLTHKIATPHEAYWHKQRVKLTKGAAFNNTNVEVRVAKDMIVEGRLVVLGTLLVEGVVTADRIVLGGPERRLENQGPVHTTPKGSWAGKQFRTFISNSSAHFE